MDLVEQLIPQCYRQRPSLRMVWRPAPMKLSFCVKTIGQHGTEHFVDFLLHFICRQPHRCVAEAPAAPGLPLQARE
eukprot:9065089-Pyramimonas_sp.AAC.1